MIVVAHRRNTLAERDATPPSLGVEIDVRVAHGRVVVTHDSVLGPPELSASLPTLDEWLVGYRGALLIVNVKEEGIEDVVRAFHAFTWTSKKRSAPDLLARGIHTNPTV